MPQLNKKEKKFKEARKMMKQYNESWRSPYTVNKDAVLVPLDKPIRVGFDRYFVIRPDLLRSPKKALLESLLPILNNTCFSKTRKFLRKDWKTGKMVPMEQELNVLDERKYTALTPQQKSYFVLEKSKVKQWHGAIRIDTVYVFKFPWMFEFKMKPSFITHREIPDGERESISKKLGDKLWGQMFAYEAGIASRGWYRDDDYAKTKKRALERLVKDDVREALDH
jgi:hypothetical protein